MSSLRWGVGALLFAATTINYIDRQTLSVAAPYIRESLSIDNEGYGYAVGSFLAAYTVKHVVAGRVLDAVGTRLGFAVAVAWWPVASMLHAFSRESTTVVFWSDHGYGLGEHGQWMKQTVFEYAAGSPLLMCGAGVPARGQTCGRTVEFLDMYPTLADLCGLKDVPKRLHGTSLRPLLENPRAPWDRPAVTQVQRARQGGPVRGYSLRTERHRYTMWDGGREGEELYDYAGDPRELKNLATADQTVALKTSLKSRLQMIIASRQT